MLNRAPCEIVSCSYAQLEFPLLHVVTVASYPFSLCICGNNLVLFFVKCSFRLAGLENKMSDFILQKKKKRKKKGNKTQPNHPYAPPTPQKNKLINPFDLQ